MADRVADGRVVMMTGAGRGMGRAMSAGLAGAGAKIVMIDIDEDVLMEAAAEMKSTLSTRVRGLCSSRNRITRGTIR